MAASAVCRVTTPPFFFFLVTSFAVGLFFLGVETVVDLAIDPVKLAYPPTWVAVDAFPITVVVLELSLIALPIGPGVPTPSLLDVGHVLPLKSITLGIAPHSLSLPLASHEPTLVMVAVMPAVFSLPIELSSIELANVLVSVGLFLLPKAMFQSLQYFSLVEQPLSIEDACLSSLLARHEVSNVAGTPLVKMTTLTVGFALHPLSVVAHSLLSLKPDGAPALSHSILEPAQVHIPSHHVLEPKAVLFSLNGQVSLPLSDVNVAVSVADQMLVP